MFSIWLPYDRDIWIADSRRGATVAELKAACDSSRRDLETMTELIDERLAESNLVDIPVIVAGDFNSMSHLDYAAHASDQYGFCCRLVPPVAS